MSLLVFTYRKQQIIALKSSLNFKIMQLNQKLMDLATYSAAIADGSVSGRDLMDAPASVFDRMVNFTQYSSQFAQVGANEKANMYFAMNQGAMAQVPPELQQQYQQMIYQGFFKQEREKACESEKAILNAQEKRINQELSVFQTQLKQIEAEEETISKGIDDAAKKSAPQYVA